MSRTVSVAGACGLSRFAVRQLWLLRLLRYLCGDGTATLSGDSSLSAAELGRALYKAGVEMGPEQHRSLVVALGGAKDGSRIALGQVRSRGDAHPLTYKSTFLCAGPAARGR